MYSSDFFCTVLYRTVFSFLPESDDEEYQRRSDVRLSLQNTNLPGPSRDICNSGGGDAAATGGRQQKRQRSEISDPGWCSVDTPIDMPIFEEQPCVTAPIDNTSTALDCFQVFFSDFVVKLIKQETNRYAASMYTKLKRANKIKKNSRWNSWVPVKLQDIYLFFFRYNTHVFGQKTKSC